MKILFFLLAISPSVLAKTILIADPEVIKIPILENNEGFIDLRQKRQLAYGPSPEVKHNQNYTWMRTAIYHKLRKADRMLPKGLHLCIYEAYRSLELQKQLFHNHYQQIRLDHSDWSPAQVFRETTRLVSPVINLNGSKNMPPHASGAAIDIYLIDDEHHPVDMGIHPKDWMLDQDGKLSQTESKAISKKAKQYRQIMARVLADQGLVNYPAEYWHWSYGDRYWALVKHQPYAFYGPKKLGKTGKTTA
jgi:D-alanyl-D-alanine dipeptidase